MQTRMKSICIMIALVAFAALGPVSAAQQSDPPKQQGDTMKQNQTTGANADTAQISADDRRFIMTAAHSNIAEVELGRIGVERASNDEVKQFAQRMIDDHTRAYEELSQLATTKGVTVPMMSKPTTDTDTQEAASQSTTTDAQKSQSDTTTRTQSDPETKQQDSQDKTSTGTHTHGGSAEDMKMHQKHQERMNRLSKLSGAEFDRAYMAHMVKDHAEASKLFQREASQGKDAEVKAWAAKTLPAIQEHHRLAQEISGKLKGDMSKPAASTNNRSKSGSNRQL